MDTSPVPWIWRDRDFVRLWSAGTISIFGSLIGRTALPFVAILTLGAGALEVTMRGSLWIGLTRGVPAFLSIWFSPLRAMHEVPAAPLGPAVAGAAIPLTE